MEMEGIKLPKGFYYGSCLCHIKESSQKEDVALIVSNTMCDVGIVYTKNIVKADPLLLNQQTLQDGKAQAIIVNSGNANACAKNGMENAIKEQQAAACLLDLKPQDVIVASTGVIGAELPVEKIEKGLDQIHLNDSESAFEKAAIAIMTTDTKMKIAQASLQIGQQTVRIAGMCKGSGMIHPNMGTMLAFICTDAKIESSVLQKLVQKLTKKTFNRISVDGDTSTNDMCIVLANGQAMYDTIQEEEDSLFEEALFTVMKSLAIQIASDGEGASRLLEIMVTHAKNEKQAEQLAMSVCSSSLFKAAMFGKDANWGRILCAMGYSGAVFDVNSVTVSFSSKEGEICVCQKGKGVSFDEEKATKILSADRVQVHIDLQEGNAEATCWGCDLTYDYVKINGDYRT